MGTPECQNLAIRVAGTRTSLVDLLWSLEAGPIPESVQLNQPDLTARQWDAAMRIVVLILGALESERLPGGADDVS